MAKELKDVPYNVEVGTRVVYAHPENGFPAQRKKAAKHLTVGETYTVVSRVTHSWVTFLMFKETARPLSFNSVLFALAEDQDG